VKRFVVPPSWPTPPRRSWLPPRTWTPDPDWPPAPKGWKFWVNGKGKPVVGPIGRYGAPSVRAVAAGLSAVVVFCFVNVWAFSAVGVFDGDPPKSQAGPVIAETPSTSVTVTPSAPTTTARPSEPATAQSTTSEPVVLPTARPTTPQPSRSEQRGPTPTGSTRPVPSQTITPTPTQEEDPAEYCRRQGWNPKWCEFPNWPTRTPGGHRPRG
jgi:hypothetical protein